LVYYCPLHFIPENRSFVVYDLETTGLRPEFDQILEFGAIRVTDGHITNVFQTFCKPSVPIPEFITTKVNNITEEMVANAPTIRIALSHFLSFVGERIVIGHNIIGFDNKFIKANREFFFGKSFWNRSLDTLIMARQLLQGKDKDHPEPLSEEHPEGWVVENHRLNPTLTEYFHIQPQQAHRAVSDVLDCYKVFIELEKLATPQFAEQIDEYYHLELPE
jgi:DNA polymerase III epsilon subunit-like protein